MVKRVSPFWYKKLKSLSEQNADPVLWQIADPYIGLVQFLAIRRMKSFSMLSFIDLIANFGTYLMIDFRKT